MWYAPGKRLIKISVAAIFITLTGLIISANSQPPPKEEAPEPAPPAGQTYVGSKACSACHFKQFTTWKKTKHAKEAWVSVPAKYQTNPDCLKCHATGYGQPSGFKDAAATPNLVGTTCEACHGPGSEHEKVCKPFLNKKTLSPEEEKAARDSIYKVLPKNVCVACHLVQGHQDHPKYDKQ
ncbi:MAG: cytochrome c family protein [Thermoguttaceae bacterium]|jgi:mono/diheme cytochrome c family protein